MSEADGNLERSTIDRGKEKLLRYPKLYNEKKANMLTLLLWRSTQRSKTLQLSVF